MPKIILTCVDCGKKTNPMYPSWCKKLNNPHRCRKCAQILNAKNPIWLEKHKIKNKELATDAVWIRNQKLGCEKRELDPIAKENRKKAIQKTTKSRSWKTKQKSGCIIRSKEKTYLEQIRLRNKIQTQDIVWYENLLISRSGQGFWYGHKTLHPEYRRKTYCELWNKDLKNRIDAAWDYKSAISGKTRLENLNCNALDHHHVYWQEKACCIWDEDANGYYANINLGNKKRPNIIKYYIKGDPNKFVLLTHDEHTMIKGSKKSGKDKIFWIKYFEEIIEKRESEGKKCYLSKEEYETYKIEHADIIEYYTQRPSKYKSQPLHIPQKENIPPITQSIYS